MTLQELILAAKPQLSHVQSENVMRDLRKLAAHALGIDPSRLSLHMQDEISADVQATFVENVARRQLSMPISKIVKKRMFWGRDFDVDVTVLDPRGDTETLIQACLDLPPQARVLDLGTGSGAIGLTLAAEWPDAKVLCTDISKDALKVAKTNAARLGVEEQVTLLQSNWFEQVDGKFDLIVSNPPYISITEYHKLDIEVRDFDPRISLTDEGDGLSAYRLLAAQSDAYFPAGGTVIVEIGHQQGKAIQALFQEAGFTNIQCLPDIAGRDRVVSAVKGA